MRIIDYKTGSIEINREYIESGYKPQLMLYMNAVVEADSELMPAGVFYFKIGELDVNADSAGTPEEKGVTVADRVAESCRLEGVLIKEENILKAMDGAFEPMAAKLSIRCIKEGRRHFREGKQRTAVFR